MNTFEIDNVAGVELVGLARHCLNRVHRAGQIFSQDMCIRLLQP